MSLCSGLYRQKRTAATHVLVVMISTESRSRKPYALPVQCISYSSLTVSELRRILGNILSTMCKKGMDVTGMKNVMVYCLSNVNVSDVFNYYIGFVSNGEFNSMRVKGYTRPLSVLQIKVDARKKYQRMALSTMLDMLSPVGRSIHL